MKKFKNLGKDLGAKEKLKITGGGATGNIEWYCVQDNTPGCPGAFLVNICRPDTDPNPNGPQGGCDLSCFMGGECLDPTPLCASC